MQHNYLSKVLINMARFMPLQNQFCRLDYNKMLVSPFCSPLFKKISYQFSYKSVAIEEDEQKEQRNEGAIFSKYITDPNVMKILKNEGLNNMFPIQQMTYDLLYEGKDLLASDRTGSGKTLAYTLPIIERFRASKYHLRSKRSPKFLILCPTRELACQVTSEIEKFNRQFQVTTLYGGASISKQANDLQRGVDIIVATPGRLIDMIQRGNAKLNDLEVVCLDEADTMLEKGFKLDVQRIFEEIRKQANGKTQNIMFSATIPSWVRNIANQYFSKDTKTINLIKKQSVKTSETVEHYAIYIDKEERNQAAKKLIEQYNPNSRTIIFTQTKAEANIFIKYFDQRAIAVLHGDISQSERQYNLKKFRSGEKKILIATDVAARGLDIPDVELIIQLSPPFQPDNYIHRSGRTGRAGKKGTNITFFNKSNIQDLIQIQRNANISIKLFNPNAFALDHWIKQLKQTVESIQKIKIDQKDALFNYHTDQLLSSMPARQVIIKLLKHSGLTIPKTVSSINNKQGFASYVIKDYGDFTKQKLMARWPGIVLHHFQKTTDQIIFDVAFSKYHDFSAIIENSKDLNISPLQESKQSSLKQFEKQLSGKRFRNYNTQKQSGSNKWNSREQTERRYVNNSNYENKSGGQNPYQKKSTSGYQKNSTTAQSGKTIFIYNISKEANEADLKLQIQAQSGISNFKLKLIQKNDQNNPGYIKSFAFIQLQKQSDAQKILNSRVNYKGKELGMKISV